MPAGKSCWTPSGLSSSLVCVNTLAAVTGWWLTDSYCRFWPAVCVLTEMQWGRAALAVNASPAVGAHTHAHVTVGAYPHVQL